MIGLLYGAQNHNYKPLYVGKENNTMRNSIKHTVLIVVCGILILGITPRYTFAADSVEIRVHPNIELLSVVLSMTTWIETREPPDVSYHYGEDIEDHFARFKNHDAVKLAQELTDRGFTYDAPPGFILYFSEPPALKKLYPYSEYLTTRAGGENILDEFADALRRFAGESDFTLFYEEHQDFYQQLVESVRRDFDQENLVSDLEGFFGVEQASYTIILAPYMFLSGGYGSRIHESGKFHCYEIMRVSEIKQGMPSFGSSSDIYYLSLHEFGHSFVNPTTEDFRSEVIKYSGLFTPVADKMKSMAYGTWETMLNETLIRAFTCYTMYEESGTQKGKSCLSKEKNKGFYFIEDIYELYVDYMKTRDIYPDFKSFYPHILDKLEEIASEDSPGREGTLKGPINDVFYQHRDGIRRVLIVYGTQNPDPAGTEIDKQRAYWLQDLYRDRHRLTIEVKADEEVTETDIQEYNLILYGGPVSNSIVAEINEDLPIRFENTKGEWSISAGGKHYVGNDVGLIMVCPNPLQPAHYVEIYAGLTREGTQNANNVFHGPTDYVIFNRESWENRPDGSPGPVLLEGFFDKSDPYKWKLLEEEICLNLLSSILSALRKRHLIY